MVTSSWKWLAARRREPKTLAKMAAGNVMVGLAFVFLAAAGSLVVSGEKEAAAAGAAAQPQEAQEPPGFFVSFWWVFAAELVVTVGELHVQPVGLSFISRYAPPGAGSLMMGVWYTSAFAGSLLGGVVGQLYSVLSLGEFYLLVAVAATVNGLVMVAAVPTLQRWVIAGGGKDGERAGQIALRAGGSGDGGSSDEVEGAEKNALLP